MNKKNKKILGWVLVSPIILIFVGLFIFAVYNTYQSYTQATPEELSIMFKSMGWATLFAILLIIPTIWGATLLSESIKKRRFKNGENKSK